MGNFGQLRGTLLLARWRSMWRPSRLGAVASRWSSDEWARGSYSFVAVGASAADYTALAVPLTGGRLCFAGEHCCREHPDTVGGAMLTGVRAANTALSFLGGGGLARGRD